MSVVKGTDPRAVIHRRTGAIALSVPFTVEGEEHVVNVGIQATSIPEHVFKNPATSTRLRAAVAAALTGNIIVKYEKGLVERQPLTDVLTDVISARAREA